MGSHGGEHTARWWLADQVVPHLHADKLGGTTGERDRPRNPGFQLRKRKPQLLDGKTCGACSSRRNSQPHRRVPWRDPQGPRTYTNPLTWESSPEGPNLLVGSGGSDWKPAKCRASGIVPSRIPPPYTAPQHRDGRAGVAPPWQIHKAPPLIM